MKTLKIKPKEYEILKLALIPQIDLTYFDAMDVCRTLKGVIERNERLNN